MKRGSITDPSHDTFDSRYTIFINDEKCWDNKSTEKKGKCRREDDGHDFLPMSGGFSHGHEPINPERPKMNHVMDEIDRQGVFADDTKPVFKTSEGLRRDILIFFSVNDPMECE